jgi:hypothetical protein
MTTPTAAMTKLDAVNLMLASIGQSPLNTITGTIPKDAAKAVISLDNALRELLTSGWSFNSDREYPLSPDGNGRIDIPANAIFADPTWGENYTMRWDTGGTPALRLYNNNERDFTSFTQDVKVDIIWLFDYEEIPQHARQLVAMKAGRKFQAGIVASTILYQFTREMETEAYAGFRRMEKRQKDFNINKHSAGVSRRRNPTRY